MDHLDIDPDDPEFHEVPDVVIHPARREYLRQRRIKIQRLILCRRKVRDTSNPYFVTYETFVQSYRLSQDCVESLVTLIRPFVSSTSSELALPLEIKILGVLSFYATGSYQTPTGRQFDVGVSQPTMSQYIKEITNALNEDEVLGTMVKFPATAREVDAAVERNRALGGKLSNIVGYTDGSLIKIKKPSLEENVQAFIGRKSFASINVMFTCDRRLYISNVNAKFPGATYDSFIFQGSALRRRMRNLYEQRRCHLLGDSGYQLEPWMLTPCNRDDRPEEDTPEYRYNKAHASDRNVAERAIGSIKNRFRALNDERVLHYHYLKVAKIVNAITVVHNLAVLANIPVDDANYYNANVHGGAPEEDELGEDDIIDLLNQGRAVRQRMIEDLERRRRQ